MNVWNFPVVSVACRARARARSLCVGFLFRFLFEIFNNHRQSFLCRYPLYWQPSAFVLSCFSRFPLAGERGFSTGNDGDAVEWDAHVMVDCLFVRQSLLPSTDSLSGSSFDWALIAFRRKMLRWLEINGLRSMGICFFSLSFDQQTIIKRARRALIERARSLLPNPEKKNRSPSIHNTLSARSYQIRRFSLSLTRSLNSQCC